MFIAMNDDKKDPSKTKIEIEWAFIFTYSISASGRNESKKFLFPKAGFLQNGEDQN